MVKYLLGTAEAAPALPRHAPQTWQRGEPRPSGKFSEARASSEGDNSWDDMADSVMDFLLGSSSPTAAHAPQGPHTPGHALEAVSSIRRAEGERGRRGSESGSESATVAPDGRAGEAETGSDALGASARGKSARKLLSWDADPEHRRTQREREQVRKGLEVLLHDVASEAHRRYVARGV